MIKRKIYIDTDISLGTPHAEIDDGAALILALQSDELDIVGMGSVFGNVSQADAWLNLQRIVKYLDKEDIPLSSGAAEPICSNMKWFDEWQSGYEATLDWQGVEASESAQDMIVRLARQYAGELEIISIGPMTNLALALQKAPEITTLVKQVIVMGGSFSGTDGPPEFNLQCDPDAADIVFNAGWPVVVFGLDVTRKALFTRGMFDTLDSQNKAVLLLKQLSGVWIERVESMGWEEGGCSLHDAVAITILLKADIFTLEVFDRINVELQDDVTKGSARAIRSKGGSGSIKIAMDMKSDICRNLIWSRIKEV